MSGNSLSQRKAQLDKAEREHLEDIVVEMRKRVEDNVRFQLTQFNLDTRPSDDETWDKETQRLVEAIELEAVDDTDWDEAFEEYVDGVGYTIVNRMAALRCMEVRDFIAEEVTVFKQNGLTPAAETLVNQEFLLEDEAILAAYHNICDELAAEIEILFDRSTAYSLVDPDDDTFAELCEMLDEVPDEVWRADDVLGWVYEYYNRPVVEALDAKNTLEPEDVGPANQFYTPHWVVRMLADNSLGKLYLEATDQESTIPDSEALSVDERKERLVTPEDSPTVAELCTYLIPDEDQQEAPEFDHPSEIRVIDPACGSGHFLLYAFDILERIWWTETDLDRSEIPAKILENNLYGVDIDLRSCQLSAFNLYLKARTRAEAEDGSFEMPNVGIVAADARVAEIDEAVDVLDQITGDETEVREALSRIIEDFQTTEALGSLLDVQGTLSEEFMESQTDVMEWSGKGPHTLNEFLKRLREAVDKRTSDSFGEQNLRSFLNLLVVLSQEYDVSLINPPYGSRGRMPNNVQEYIKNRYEYTPEYYINFTEMSNRLVKKDGRIGMLVPRSFMFLKTFEEFREAFIKKQGSFDFLAEFGIGILDNATVRTAGIVIRSGKEANERGTFIRLNDADKSKKEDSFIHSGFVNDVENGIRRRFNRDISEFDLIPGSPLSYWVPKEIRDLYQNDTVLGKKGEYDGRHGISEIRPGITTGDDTRFLQYFWENTNNRCVPISKGGVDSWLLPKIKNSIVWENNGSEVRRFSGGNGTPSEEFYFKKGITFNRVKESGKRFGYLHSNSIFGDKAPVMFSERDIWSILSYVNSSLFTYLMLSQTTGRMWEAGQVAKIPWKETMENKDVSELSRMAVGYVISKRQYDFNSPHYNGNIILSLLDISASLPTHEGHPHRELREELEIIMPDEKIERSTSLNKIGISAARHFEDIDKQLQSCIDEIERTVFDCFNITDDQRELILQEIALRTNEDPRERKEHNTESITEPSNDFPQMVKDLLLHLTLKIVHEDADGIVPISAVDSEPDLLDRIIDEFERIWGEHAADRLAETDQLLGSQPADEEAYPNLRAWLEDDLFDYHVSKFDRTPILWRLTTERLVSDPEGEGFACLADYHQLDGGVFDRLQNRYLEPRKALLRERRSAANRRRGDDSLSTSEKAAAAEAYERCESGLEQVAVFEDQLTTLAQPEPREWPADQQELAATTAEQVDMFRQQVESRLSKLEELAAMDDVDMEDVFTPTFYETVQQNREEWVDALADLQAALDAYATGDSEPFEAHLYDLFEYYDDLVGSTHFASNGILFMNYYFDKFEDAGQSQIGDGGISERQRLCSELAKDLDSYESLAEEIADACDKIAGTIPSDWETRALSEITTAGYRPNRKHGVETNIKPLAEAEIVPKTVDDKVL